MGIDGCQSQGPGLVQRGPNLILRRLIWLQTPATLDTCLPIVTDANELLDVDAIVDSYT